LGLPPNALTVRAVLEEWFIEQIEPRYRVTGNARVYINRATAEFGAMRLQELEHAKSELKGFIRRYAKEAPVAANRCLATLKLAFSWCREVGDLDRNSLADMTKRIAGGEESSRARVLSDAEIRQLWHLESTPR
jgi:hypothetical protein